MRDKSIDNVIEKGCQFVLENSKIIKIFRQNLLYNDEPKLFSYFINFKDKFENEDTDNAVANGVSFNKQKALLKVLGETVERYCLGLNNNNEFIFSSYNELVAKKRSVVDPCKFQINNKNSIDIKNQKFHWVKGKKLENKEIIYIPSQLVYVPYIYENDEIMINHPSSSGAAAGTSLEDAILRGIFELIERDSFIISYLNKIHSPIVNLKRIRDPQIKKIIASLKRYNLELKLVDIAMDLGIPVYAAVLIDKSGIGPAVSVGLKSGFNQHDVAIGAIEEALMVRSGIRDQYALNSLTSKNINFSLENRAKFWYPLSSVKHLNFWLKNKNKKNFIKKRREKSLKELNLDLKKKNLEIYYIDIADKLIKNYGFEVVKVIIPQLQPLFFSYSLPEILSERVFNVPVLMNIRKEPNLRKNLNKLPHPFL